KDRRRKDRKACRIDAPIPLWPIFHSGWMCRAWPDNEASICPNIDVLRAVCCLDSRSIADVNARMPIQILPPPRCHVDPRSLRKIRLDERDGLRAIRINGNET